MLCPFTWGLNIWRYFQVSLKILKAALKVFSYFKLSVVLSNVSNLINSYFKVCKSFIDWTHLYFLGLQDQEFPRSVIKTGSWRKKGGSLQNPDHAQCCCLFAAAEHCEGKREGSEISLVYLESAKTPCITELENDLTQVTKVQKKVVSFVVLIP